MNILTIDLIFTITILTSLVIVLLVFYTNQQTKLRDYLSQKKKLEEELHAFKLQSPHQGLLSTIDSALGQTSNQIIEETRLFREKAEGLLKKQLSSYSIQENEAAAKISQDYLREYQQALTVVKKNNIKIIQTILNTIKSDAQNSIQDFKDIIEKETLKSQKIVEEKIEREYEDLRKELDVYKQKRLSQIDNSIYEILEQVSKEVLGKALRLSEQETLILEALRNAKEDGVL